MTVALVLAPGGAGRVARGGEGAGGAGALLLTTRVSAREIVAGRLAGKLSQVGMILLAGVPAVVGLAALWRAARRVGSGSNLLLAGGRRPFGAGGLAVLASTVSRRGRDALLAVYLVELFLMLTPLLGGLGLRDRGGAVARGRRTRSSGLERWSSATRSARRVGVDRVLAGARLRGDGGGGLAAEAVVPGAGVGDGWRRTGRGVGRCRRSTRRGRWSGRSCSSSGSGRSASSGAGSGWSSSSGLVAAASGCRR